MQERFSPQQATNIPPLSIGFRLYMYLLSAASSRNQIFPWEPGTSTTVNVYLTSRWEKKEWSKTGVTKLEQWIEDDATRYSNNSLLQRTDNRSNSNKTHRVIGYYNWQKLTYNNCYQVAKHFYTMMPPSAVYCCQTVRPYYVCFTSFFLSCISPVEDVLCYCKDAIRKLHNIHLSEADNRRSNHSWPFLHPLAGKGICTWPTT